MANISITEIPLICHPQSDANGVESLVVTISHAQNGEIGIIYRVAGALETLEIAAPVAGNRVDGLWKSTCFELFVCHFEDSSYLEYNFSPSGQWAAYQFASYRDGVSELEASAPSIEVKQNGNTLTLSASLQLPVAWRARKLSACISAVVATKNGDISYWAVAHPPGKPDFHHRDCFAVQLEARSAP